MLIHYILVRRDLPFGVTLAQVAHAAAESNNLAGHCTVAVLGVRNENRLKKISYKLKSKEVAHVDIREPDAPWNGQLMAVGVVPGEREDLASHFKDLQAYREPNQIEYPVE
jgi:peptidyl-tRNA hydrolase